MNTALRFGERLAAVSGIGLWLIVLGYSLVNGATADAWLGFGLFLVVFALVAGVWTFFSRERKAAKETDRLKAELTQLQAAQTPQLWAASHDN
jgi:uncharacterized membrane protein YbhN (UPF0104 family)